MTTSGESESDDSEMGRLQGMFAFAFISLQTLTLDLFLGFVRGKSALYDCR